jgi:hypothetical protein
MSTDIQRVAQAFDDAADILELNYRDAEKVLDPLRQEAGWLRRNNVANCVGGEDEVASYLQCSLSARRNEIVRWAREQNFTGPALDCALDLCRMDSIEQETR